MSPQALEHPFWWRVFERPDARFSADEVATVQCVTVHEHVNESLTPDVSATALLVLTDGRRASIRAHYHHDARCITDVRWYTERPELPTANAA